MLSRRRLGPTLALASVFTLAAACTDKPEPDAKTDADPGPKDESPDEPGTPEQVAGELPKVAPATTDSAPIADHGEVLATIQLPSGVAMREFSALTDFMKPGASFLLRSQAPTMLEDAMGMSFDDAELEAPIAALVLDPLQHPKPLALLVKVGDAEGLTKAAEAAKLEIRIRDGLALVGTSDVIEAAEDYAFDNLSAASDHSEIVLYPSKMIETFRPQIEEGIGSIGQLMAMQGGGASLGAFMDIYTKGLVSSGEQIERLVVSVSPGQDNIDVTMRAYPVAGGSMETFIAAQVPSDHTLLAKLPADAGLSMIMSGGMRAGDSREAIFGFGCEAMTAIYASGPSAEEWMALFVPWLDTTTGDFAAAIDMKFALPADDAQPGTPPKMTVKWQGLYAISEAESSRSAWRNMLQAMVDSGGGATQDMMGMKVETKLELDVLTYGDIPVDRYTTHIDPSSLTPDQRRVLEGSQLDQEMQLAIFDTFGAMTTTMGSTEEDGVMKTLIDAARGDGDQFEASGDLDAALRESTARGESFVYYFDIGAIAPPETDIPFSAMSMSMGRDGSALLTRFSFRR